MNFHLSLLDFEKQYKKEKNGRAKTRLHILLLRRQKYTQQEIAVILHVTQGTVSNVCRRFLKGGWGSVYDKQRSGKPSKLASVEKQQLHDVMQHDFTDGKINRGWQTKDVRAYMKKHFGKTLSVWQTRRIMHAFGMSWKVPRPEHKNRNEKAVKAFKKSSQGRYCLWQMSTRSSA